MSVHVEIPSRQEFLRNGANIDRMLAIIENSRVLNRDAPMEPNEELALLFKAAHTVDDGDLKMMWALLMLREAERK